MNSNHIKCPYCTKKFKTERGRKCHQTRTRGTLTPSTSTGVKNTRPPWEFFRPFYELETDTDTTQSFTPIFKKLPRDHGDHCNSGGIRIGFGEGDRPRDISLTSSGCWRGGPVGPEPKFRATFRRDEERNARTTFSSRTKR
uniref:Alpha-amylase A n=1 Tax=Lygus hesperus TaxID=30085 RepID=A0A0A9YLN6_LYGHE